MDNFFFGLCLFENERVYCFYITAWNYACMMESFCQCHCQVFVDSSFLDANLSISVLIFMKFYHKVPYYNKKTGDWFQRLWSEPLRNKGKNGPPTSFFTLCLDNNLTWSEWVSLKLTNKVPYLKQETDWFWRLWVEPFGRWGQK